MGNIFDAPAQAFSWARARRLLPGRAVRGAMALVLSLSAGLALGADGEAVARPACAPAAAQPAWGAAEIRASRVVHRSDLPARPAAVFGGIDVRDLVIAVDAGGRQVTVLDGARFEPVYRLPGGRTWQGAPKFAPDGRFLYFASPDGWVGKFDLWNLALVAEVRVGLDTVDIAVAADGAHVAVANCLPRTLVLLDADLGLLKMHAVLDKSGRNSSRVAALRDAASRQSFVVALEDAPEVWEISYDPKAEDVPIGVIHDFQYREGAFVRGYLNPRRSAVPTPLADFTFAPDHSELLGATRAAGKAQVVNLDVRKRIAEVEVSALARPGAAEVWDRNGRPVMALRERGEGAIGVVDLETWRTVRRIPMPGPGRFVRSHAATRYAWADSTMPGAGVALQVIDKRTLESVTEVTLASGGTLLHLAFTRDGRHLLASLGEPGAGAGALVVLDATTFAQVRRIPMDMPIGAYGFDGRIERPGAPAS